MKPALIINSHSSNEECLRLYFFCLKKYIRIDMFEKIYLFIDKELANIPSYIKTVVYNQNESFRDQMIYCLKKVDEEILLYTNEDYLFYDNAKTEVINSSLEKLKNSTYSFIKFTHTDLEKYQEIEKNYFLIDKYCENNYSQALSFWKVNDLLNIHLNCPQSDIGKKGDLTSHLEIEAKNICKKLDISGLCYYNNEPKRGLFHYDSEAFPHVASALNRGIWNLEYPEIEKLKQEFKEYENNK